MEVFRDLYVRGNAEKLAATMDEVERCLAGGWARDRAAEGKLQSIPSRTRPAYCFSCVEEGARPAATVFLTEKQSGLYHASNVVPSRTHQLSYGEYNAVLEELCERFLRPGAAKTGAQVELTGTRGQLESWLSPLAAEKFRTFCATAHKGIGSAHPQDRERWNEFVVAAYRDGARLDASTLRRWLNEVEGWAPEVADRLAGQYEFGRELLAAADSRRSA